MKFGSKTLSKMLARCRMTAGRILVPEMFEGVRFTGRYLVRCYDYYFNLKWEEPIGNIVVNEGLSHALDVVLSGGSQDTSWFVGLLSASPSPAAGWTATEIASNDFVAYDESNLPAFTDGGESSQSLDNSASPASFAINSDSSSIGGAFLIGTNAKGTPAGTLYSAGAFSGGNKAADDGDTLEVTMTFTAADDGA